MSELCEGKVKIELFFFFSSRRRHTRLQGDWSSDVCSSDLICEQWLPLWRALNANQGDSAELKSRILLVRQAILKRIELMYRTELATLEEREHRQILIAIETLVDFESWAHMREHKGLSFAEACAVWIHAIDRLLPPT